MPEPIDSSDSMIDSRDVQERIDELMQEGSFSCPGCGRIGTVDDGINVDDLECPDEECDGTVAPILEEGDELTLLLQLKTEVEDVTSEWDDGAQIVADSYFVDFAKELVIDCGYFGPDITAPSGPYGERKPLDWDSWPYKHIDWDGVAEDLKADYSEIVWDGESFWVRDS